jgi:hypothetical protein
MKNFYLFPILIVSATLGCLDYIIYIKLIDLGHLSKEMDVAVQL